MANHTQQLLTAWHPQKDSLNWILATIIETDGSSYRKPGAMMMINSLGQYHGLLSGGCLESDIMRQSRRCWETGNNRIIQYDMREEEDLAWQLGIGCGGLVRILLQVVNARNHYLQLEKLLQLINENIACKYRQNLQEKTPNNSVFEYDLSKSKDAPTTAKRVVALSDNTPDFFEHIIQPAIRIAILGGGIDAIPVVKLANDMAWHITLVDSRAGYARKTQFEGAKQIIKTSLSNVDEHKWVNTVDAIIIMTHNVKLDALALSLAQKSSAKYVGMLGPIHRTNRVLAEANLCRPRPHTEPKSLCNVNILSKPLANPIGLQLGGELPESIALSMISEIHAFLENANAESISSLL